MSFIGSPAYRTGQRIDRPRPRPGLDVSLTTQEQAPHATLDLAVRGGTAPVRLHLYVDGELAESWAPAPERCRFDLRTLEAGRHAVTARAIDRDGRWGGASLVVAVAS